MRKILSIVISGFCLLAGSCDNMQERPKNIHPILDSQEQDSVFNKLMQVTHNLVPAYLRNDSLSFLILPLHASCPSCRKKTIDSIVENSNRLLPQQLIVIAARGGIKTITRYFKEQHSVIPSARTLFLDSTDRSGELGLYDDKPTIYYTFNGKAYTRVAVIPATIKEDLSSFFSTSKVINKTTSSINDKLISNEEPDNQNLRQLSR
ncbi:hypothetical protein [Niastella populi]|uniref:Uncharacterized protein n=1 Tax=Niastella populi TaxID=550983 RepID=A0A1V9GAK8_9BACT|nr:hypothetical protein [Niastella populi]OQP67610.1 hypothetical protein A4R26_12420 [Niastella populi]